MRGQSNLVHPVPAIVPIVQTNADTAFTSAIIDRKGFESLTFLVITGVLTDAGCTIAATMEHGDDSGLSDTAAVAQTDLVGTLAAMAMTQADDTECRKIGYVGAKRYVRLTLTPTGNAAGAIPIAAIALMGDPANSPTATL